jgi:hypothetical protein
VGATIGAVDERAGFDESAGDAASLRRASCRQARPRVQRVVSACCQHVSAVAIETA